MPWLAEVVIDLYEAALRASSRRTYGTGQRAYERFITTMEGGVYYPFMPTSLTETELNLAFYMASLLLKPSITTAGTILGYECHVKSAFRENGCTEYEYSTQFLKQVRRGIKNTLPAKADKRGALLLPLLTMETSFLQEEEPERCLLQFMTTIGFIAMLRPHVFEQLRPDSFTMVTYTGRLITMPRNQMLFRHTLTAVRREQSILGFFIDYQSKTKRNARSYLPSLSSRGIQTPLVKMCPVRGLIKLTGLGLVRRNFLKQVHRKNILPKYLQELCDRNCPVATYALRIGGRTWKLTQGMDRQLVDFLGIWKSPEASARYFRGNPRSILLMVRQFYIENDPNPGRRNGDSAGSAQGDLRGSM